MKRISYFQKNISLFVENIVQNFLKMTQCTRKYFKLSYIMSIEYIQFTLPTSRNFPKIWNTIIQFVFNSLISVEKSKDREKRKRLKILEIQIISNVVMWSSKRGTFWNLKTLL